MARYKPNGASTKRTYGKDHAKRSTLSKMTVKTLQIRAPYPKYLLVFIVSSNKSRALNETSEFTN